MPDVKSGPSQVWYQNLDERDNGDSTFSLATGPSLYNGVTWDPQNNNLVGTLLVSAARTTTLAGIVMANPNHRGLILYVNVTAASGTTPTLALRLNAIDPITATAFPLNTFAAITTTGEFVYAIYPTALAGSWTASLNNILTRTWSVDSVIGGTTPSFTYSLGYSMLI